LGEDVEMVSEIHQVLVENIQSIFDGGEELGVHFVPWKFLRMSS